MIHILVVDDEPIILNSLYQMLRDSTQWTLTVFKAANGTQAMEIARKNRIDILISDICMPNIDGLALHLLIKQEWPGCRVIFLTGHEQFEYAQQAIRQNVDSYILKIEGDDVILAALDQCITSIEDEKRNMMLLRHVEASLPVLQRELILEALQDRPVEPDVLAWLQQDLKLPVQLDQPMLMGLCRIHRSSGGRENSIDLRQLFQMSSIIDEHLGRTVHHMTVPLHQDTIIVLYQPGEMISSGNAYTRVLEMLEQIQEAAVQVLSVSSVWSIDRHPCKMNELSGKFRTLEAAFHCFAFDEHSIITEDLLARVQADRPMCKMMHLEDAIPTQQQLTQLRLTITQGDEHGLMTLLQTLCPLKQSMRLTPGVHREIYYAIALVFLRLINETAAEKVDWLADPEQLMAMDNHASWHQSYAYFCDLGRSIIRSRLVEKQKWNQGLLDQINQYVQQHLADDISLVSIAERFHFHPSYLARLYKGLTGITLGQAINENRMKIAAQLLSTSDIQINDIARQLGFSSVAYFSKFFKSNSGITPSDFRRQSKVNQTES